MLSNGFGFNLANRSIGCEYWRFAGDYFGKVYGVEAQSGQPIWQANMGTKSRNFITGPFQTHKGLLFIPVASKEVFDVFSACCSSHGMLHAVAPYTGKVKWVFQATANDAWNGTCQLSGGNSSKCTFTVGSDADFGAPPTVRQLPDGTPVVIAGPKNGVVYSLKTRAKNWERKIGAGGILGGIHWGMTVDSQGIYAAVADLNIVKPGASCS